MYYASSHPLPLKNMLKVVYSPQFTKSVLISISVEGLLLHVKGVGCPNVSRL
jgi:hypothetical protein